MILVEVCTEESRLSFVGDSGIEVFQLNYNGLKFSCVYVSKIMQLVSVLFCVVTDVCKCGRGLVINERGNKGSQWKESHAGMETHIFDMTPKFFADCRQQGQGNLPRLCTSAVISRVKGITWNCNPSVFEGLI